MSEADLKRRISIHIYGEEEFTAIIFELITVIKSFQLPILVNNESSEKSSYNFEIVRNDSDVPFSTKTNNSRKAVINANFFDKYQLKSPFVNYLLYCIALALLELELKNKTNSKNIQLASKFDLDKYYQFVFGGGYPYIIGDYFDEVSKVGSIAHNFYYKCHNYLDDYSSKIKNKIRLINKYAGLIGINRSDFFNNITDVLIQTDHNEISGILDKLESDSQDGWIQLARLSRDRNSSLGESIIEAILIAPKLNKQIKKEIESLPKNVSVTTGSINIEFRGGDKEEPEEAVIGRFSFKNDDENPTDALSYRKYAEALASVIADKNTSTPLTIGICAPWGMGKTVLMNFIENELVKIKKKISSLEKKEESAKLPCDVININAWEISKAGTIWEEFYVRILTEFEDNLGRYQKVKFRYKLLWNSSKLKTIFFMFILPLISILLIIVLILNDINLYSFLDNDAESNHFTTFLNGITFISPLLVSVWRFFKSFWNDFFKRISTTRNNKNLNELETLHNIKSVKKTIKNFDVNRTIIMVDDLDRCDHENILNILESMRLFLDIPNFVFILGMDTKVVRHAVGQHYKFMCNDNDDKYEQENMGRSYLEKIIQIPFHLPSLSAEQKKELNKQILKDYVDFEDVQEDLSPTNERELVKPAAVTGAEGAVSGGGVYAGSTEAVYKETKKEAKIEVDFDEDKYAKLKKEEAQYINGLLENREFDISPRLIKRFLNIYLIARHMYISEFNKQPDKHFIHWLALSVNFPYEAKALLNWLNNNNWNDPQSILDIAKIRDMKEFPEGIIGHDLSAPFKNIKWEDYNRFSNLYLILKLDHIKIRRTKHITNCFNLILD